MLRNALDVGGEYAVPHARREPCLDAGRGRRRCSTPCARARARRFKRIFAELVNSETARAQTIRGLFKIKMAEETGRKPVPLDEVEPAADIVKRFSTGAMSFGSI